MQVECSEHYFHTYYIKEKIGKQTLYMEFQGFTNPARKDTIYFNVYLSIYNKRKHAERNEDSRIVTGANPLADAIVAIRAFDELEEYVTNTYEGRKNIIIYAHWVDNRRRDAYYKVLSKRGYEYTYLDSSIETCKVIAKTIYK